MAGLNVYMVLHGQLDCSVLHDPCYMAHDWTDESAHDVLPRSASRVLYMLVLSISMSHTCSAASLRGI